MTATRIPSGFARIALAALAAAALSLACQTGDSPGGDKAVKNAISTLAGTGPWTSTGDGGSASVSTIKNPIGLALGSDGSLYFSDANAHRIRKIDASGTISAFAGSGTQGFAGDAGAALSAQFDYPQGIALDATGALYVADSNNCRIRKIGTDGVVSTVAGGSGTWGFAGDGGPATSARLNYPTAVAFDAAGSMFIADCLNNRIRKVDASGTITTVAGASLGGSTGGYSGDDGPATAAELQRPRSMAIDATGNIYIADTLNNRIRKVDAAGIITTIAGTGAAGATGDGGLATAATLNGPQGLAIGGDGSLYIADWGNFAIRKITPSGVIATVAGICGSQGWNEGDGGAATRAKLQNPIGILVKPSGEMIIADEKGCTIRRVAGN